MFVEQGDEDSVGFEHAPGEVGFVGRSEAHDGDEYVRHSEVSEYRIAVWDGLPSARRRAGYGKSMRMPAATRRWCLRTPVARLTKLTCGLTSKYQVTGPSAISSSER